MLVLCGFFILPELSLRLTPSTSLPNLTVSYTWPNASSYNVEKEITSVLEAGLSTIRGLDKIKSISSKGSGRIILEFKKDISVKMARFETSTVIRQFVSRLPEGASIPTIGVSQSDNLIEQPFLSYSIISPKSSFEIQEFIRKQIEPVIGSIKGVDHLKIYGATSEEWSVSYDPEIFNRLDITLEEIQREVRNNFSQASLGKVIHHNELVPVHLAPKKEFKWNIPIKKIGDHIVYLDQIATIKKREQDKQQYYRVNGQNAVTLAIFPSKGVNTLDLSSNIDFQLHKLKTIVPDDYKIQKSYDSTSYLKEELSKIYRRSILTLSILLLFVLIVTRSIRYLLIILISLVSNLAIAFLLYYIFEVELQLYSLAGITISLGLIIDNSIIMIDHIRRKGNLKIFLPLLASTLTTIGSLSIIYFLDEDNKMKLIDFSRVICINLLVSLLISLILIPALLQKIPLKRTKQKKVLGSLKHAFLHFYKSFIIFSIRFRKLYIIAIILIFGLPIHMLPENIGENSFIAQAYNSTLGTQKFREEIRPSIEMVVGGTLRLFSYYVFENSFYRDKEETKLHVIAEMEKGSTIHQMNNAFLQIENYLRSLKDVKNFTTQIHSGSYGTMEISFNSDREDESFPFRLKTNLISRALNLGGIEWNIYGIGDGYSNFRGVGDPVNFRIQARGYNYNELNVWLDSLKIDLLQHPRIEQVSVRENTFENRDRSYEYTVDLSDEQLAVLKTSPVQVARDLRKLTLSKQSDFYLNVMGKYTPIRFESDDSHLFDIWSIQNNTLGTRKNPYSLHSITHIKKTLEEENIFKEDQEYLRLVEFQYTGAEVLGNKFLENTLERLKKKMPLGYHFEIKEFGDRKESKNETNYFLLFLLIFFIVYTICAVLFESFKQPFIILSIIPISFIGVFITFYLFHLNFDQGGMASFVLLSGITVNASILIVTSFNQLKRRYPKSDLVSVYLEALKSKIFPVLLSVVSTILGFLPFVIGGNEVFWFALGVGTIGGLLFSLIALFIYLPIFCLKEVI